MTYIMQGLYKIASLKPFDLDVLKIAYDDLLDLAWNITFFKLHGEYPKLEKIYD